MLSLSVIIPSHKRGDLLRACLGSVRRHMPQGTEIIVVDDGSSAATISAVAQEFEDVRVLRLDRRGGFCVAANAGIAAATHPIVEMLNDDTEVCSGWAEAALAAFTDVSIGAVAPLVLRWPDGATVDSAGDRYHLGGVAGKHGHGQTLRPEHLRPRFVFGASASCAFYRRDALIRVADGRERPPWRSGTPRRAFPTVGAFPESFGAYFEDVDLSFRLHWAGYRVLFEPRACVLHHVSASYGNRPDAALVEQQSHNEELVFWRNLPAAALLRAVPLHLAVLLGKAWRRWRRGELLPFLRGRLRVLCDLPALRRHRRQLRQWGHAADVAAWHIDRSLRPI
jgi:GT2 family glycosyltransferase